MQFSSELSLGTERWQGRELSLPRWISVSYMLGKNLSIVLMLAIRRDQPGLSRKHDFPKLRAGFEIGMSGRGFGEREDTIDDRLEFSCSNELHHHVEFRLGAHVRT